MSALPSSRDEAQPPESQSNRRRAAALDRIRAAYDRYSRSGWGRRWTGGEIGSQLAAAERDCWVIRSLRPVLRGTVVDLGCGDGNVGRTLAAAGLRPERYLGIDIIEDRLAQARSRAPWGEFLLASADQLPLPSGSVDAVVVVTLFSSIREEWFRASIAVEIARVLRRGGRLAIYDIRYPSPGNANVRPFGPRDLRHHFPGWPATWETMTLLPPLARLPLAAGALRYRLLTSIPALRSHMAATLTRP